MFAYLPFGVVKFLGPNDISFRDLDTHPNTDIQNCNADFCQIVDTDDITTFQVGLGPVGSDLVTDGGFANPCSISDWTCGAGWVIAGGVASYDGTSGALEQTINIDTTLSPQVAYQVTFTISNLVLTGSEGIQVTIGGSAAIVVTTNGTHTVTLFSDPYINNRIRFESIDGDDIFDLDNVTVFAASTVGFRIEDLDGTELFVESDGSSVVYVPAGNVANVTLDWDTFGLTDGVCVKVCVFDVSDILLEMINNGDFAGGATDWTVGATWTITTFAAGFALNGAGPPSTELINALAINLEADKIYDLTFTVSGYASGAMFVIAAGTTFATISSNGVKNVTIDMTGLSTTSGLTFRLSAEGVDADLDIDDISMIIQADSIANDRCSECFLFGDHDGTLLLQWTNTNNAFGFWYLTSFTQYMRLESTLRQPQYPRETETYRSSDGTRDIPFTQIDKQYVLAVEKIPEYMHDALSIGLGHDSFSITGLTWQGLSLTAQLFTFEEEAYPLEWKEKELTTPVDLPLFLPIDLTNDNC